MTKANTVEHTRNETTTSHSQNTRVRILHMIEKSPLPRSIQHHSIKNVQFIREQWISKSIYCWFCSVVHCRQQTIHFIRHLLLCLRHWGRDCSWPMKFKVVFSWEGPVPFLNKKVLETWRMRRSVPALKVHWPLMDWSFLWVTIGWPWLFYLGQRKPNGLLFS